MTATNRRRAIANKTPSVSLILILGVFVFAIGIFEKFPLAESIRPSLSLVVSHGVLATDGSSDQRYRKWSLTVISSDSIPVAVPHWSGWSALATDRDCRIVRFDFPPPLTWAARAN